MAGIVKRLWPLDLARGVAVLAMAMYHLSWDLSAFGLADIPLFEHWFWIGARAVIPSAFLFLMGLSLVLAHGHGIRWPALARRVAMIGGAALLVTIGSWLVFGQTYIFFGVLHCIALMSLLAVPFVRGPWWVALAAGVVVIMLPLYWSSLLFDHSWLQWVGLGTYFPNTNDYVPLFPWGGVVLVGIATATLYRQQNKLPGELPLMPAWAKPLVWAGRHALALYLLHQPVLIGLVYGYLWTQNTFGLANL